MATETELMREAIKAQGGVCDDLPDNLQSTLLKKLIETCAAGGGGGLPTGGAAHQQLVTDKNGNAKWEDRPFYSEPGIVEVSPEMTLTPDENGQALVQTPLNGAIVIGNEYTVTYNGTDYACVAQEHEGVTALGNVGVMMGFEGTGEPFVFLVVPAGMEEEFGAYAMCMCLDGATEFTIKITVQGTIYKRIPLQYLPEDMYGTEYGEETVILPETKMEGSNGWYARQDVILDDPFPGRYIVVYNGVSYETQCSYTEDGVWNIGNKNVTGNTGHENTGEPFLILPATGQGEEPFLMAIVTDVETGELYNGEVTISITRAPATVKQIPAKYLKLNPTEPLYLEMTSNGTEATIENVTADEIRNAIKEGRQIRLQRSSKEDFFSLHNSETFDGGFRLKFYDTQYEEGTYASIKSSRYFVDVYSHGEIIVDYKRIQLNLYEY